jgi:hypothetical protein
MKAIVYASLHTYRRYVTSLYSLIRTRKADEFSGFIFLGLILGVIAVLLGSLLFRRPLIYYFAERFTGRDPQMNDKWERLPSYRFNFRLITGCGDSACCWKLV